MFNPTDILIQKFIEELRGAYTKTYGAMNKEYGEIIEWIGTMSLEIISNSDAMYHNVEHTIHVTLVGQEILRGKHIREGGVSPKDWLHCIVSFLCHDIGYVKGISKLDNPEKNIFATGLGTDVVQVEDGSTDASLTPYHVSRGKLFVQERFGNHAIIDASIIQRNIEYTRFPVPDQSEAGYKHDDPFPSIVRAADLIGQLADPRYLQKVSCLFYEFAETGANKKLGYNNPGDLKKNYPRFYWGAVHNWVKECLLYLNYTQNGKQILAQLFANVFSVEHMSELTPKLIEKNMLNNA